MKKLTRILSLALILVMVLTVLASCGTRLSGTYKSDAVISLTSFTFDGDKFTQKTAIFEINGTYEIKGDEITLTYDSALAEKFNLSTTVTFSFEKDGNAIKIDGNKYNKVD